MRHVLPCKKKEKGGGGEVEAVEGSHHRTAARNLREVMESGNLPASSPGRASLAVVELQEEGERVVPRGGRRSFSASPEPSVFCFHSLHMSLPLLRSRARVCELHIALTPIS